MVKLRAKTGREGTRKHAEETRELALVLFHMTPLTRGEVARLLRVKEGAVIRWWRAEKAENVPPHRGGQGTTPKDPAGEALKENARLLVALADAEAKLAEKAGVEEMAAHGGTAYLIREAKRAMAAMIHYPGTKLGELASTVRALAELEEIERLKDLAVDAPKVIFYLPAREAGLTPEILLADSSPDPVS